MTEAARAKRIYTPTPQALLNLIARIERANTISYSKSTSLPATAACATIKGLINIVRPVGLP